MSKTTTPDLAAKIEEALRAADATADSLYATRVALTGANAAIDVLRPFLDAYAEQGRKLEAAEAEVTRQSIERVREEHPQAASTFDAARIADQAATIAALTAEVEQCAVEIEEAANVFDGKSLHGLADIYRKAAERARAALTTQGEG